MAPASGVRSSCAAFEAKLRSASKAAPSRRSSAFRVAATGAISAGRSSEGTGARSRSLRAASLSRNRRTGIELAQGKSLEEILAETTEVAEGVKNSRIVLRLAQDAGVEMPITEQMVEVLYERKPARQAVHDLMTRDLKHESNL